MDAKMRYANLEKGSPRPRRSTTKSCVIPLLVYIAVLLTGIVITLPIVIWHKSDVSVTKQETEEPQGIEAAEHLLPTNKFVEESMSWYDARLGEMTERIGVDADSQVEVITSEYHGTKTAAYLDFKKSIGGFYVSDWDECYMIGGLDHRLIKPHQVAKFVRDTLNQELHQSSELVIYEKADDYPITDRALLPRALAATCENKDVYWLRQTYLDQENIRFDHRQERSVNKRDKRFVRVCLGVCVTLKLK